MSVYTSGTEAYRDTVKWLCAFLPVGTLVASGVTLGPALVASAAGTGSVRAWLRDAWPLLICLAAVAIAIGAVLVAGGQALGAQASRSSDLINTSTPSRESNAYTAAVGAGALAPWYLDRATFESEFAAVFEHQDDGATPDERLLGRVESAVEVTRDWSTHYHTRKAYRVFLFTFGASILAVIGSTLVSASRRVSETIDKPTPVDVAFSVEGINRFSKATGCDDPATAAFVVVDGSWDHPVLSATGSGCIFGIEWRPTSADAQVRPK